MNSKIKATKLYLEIYSELISNNDKSRYHNVVTKINKMITEIRSDLREEHIVDIFEQNAIIYDVFKQIECDMSIDPSPLNPKYCEKFSLFVCDDQPKFIMIREETEIFDEWSVTLVFYDDKIETEYDL